MATIKFTNRPDFFPVLRSRIDGYFKQNNINKTGDGRLYTKTVVLLSSLVILYTILVFFTPASVILSLALCSLMGVTMAAIGFNVMHDGAHGSYSSSPRINAIMGFALNVMGGNVFIWKQKHNVNHHTYTNIEGLDDDIDVKPFMRINTLQKRNAMHKFQHIYWVLLYGLTYIFWVYYNDFDKYFNSKVANLTPITKFKFKDHFYFWMSKIVYTFMFIVLPGILVGWTEMIVGYLVMGYVTGVLIAVVFQLAHVVEKTEFVDPVRTDFSVEDEWAVHQLNTTANFATDNKFLNWLLGGLNFQVEHHLFPRISHVHYPRLNKIVIETCKEYGISYKEYPTFFSAVKSHVLHLKEVGRAA